MPQSLGAKTEGKLQMLLSPWKNGLTSLFKEVSSEVTRGFQALLGHSLFSMLSGGASQRGPESILSVPKSQRFLRFAIAKPIAGRTPEIAAISETRESNAALRYLRVRWKVAFGLRFLSPKPLHFYGISGDLAPSTRKSLAIAIVRFWCAESLSLHV